MNARFTVEFRGTAPDELRVGQELTLTGKVTVHGITAELVDVTSYGKDTSWLPGEITIELYSNKLEVSQS